MKRLGLLTLIGLVAGACGESVTPEYEFLPEVAELGYFVAPRVEVDDSITVSATDPAGLALVGWEARLLDGTLLGADSVALSGAPKVANRHFLLGFPTDVRQLSKRVTFAAFAVNTAGERSTSDQRIAASVTPGLSLSQQAAFQQQAPGIDTIIVVAGVTRALPAGGRIADAIYNRNLNEIYLTNVERDRVEIFQLVDTTFAPNGIPVGSRPWGIALWPRDQTGANGDSVVVANSGGTNLSVVDVAARVERRRHALPNFLVQSVQTEIDGATGLIKLKITEFDFSDRPEYLGTFCRDLGCSNVYALYSTTPTAGQPSFFQFRGSIRWENLTSVTPESHFFWEHAEKAPSPDTDTLQVIVDRGPGTGIDIILSAACGVTVNIEELAFIDTTFVRNSGDFTHGLVGEGGSALDPALEFARAIGYSGTAGLSVTLCPTIVIEGVPFSGREERDNGVSPSIRVRDFIVNTSIPVKSIGINFNGLTNLVRADSIYVLDEGLRLIGLVPAGGDNAGMDLNFDHNFDARAGGTPGTDGGGGNPDNRLVFVARDDATIEVYDTWFYGLVGTVPIRDAITGPLRVGRLPTGNQILIGVTAAGVVTVVLPPVVNIFPAQQGVDLSTN